MWYNPMLLMDPAVQRELGISAAFAKRTLVAMSDESMKMNSKVPQAANGKGASPEQRRKAEAKMVAYYDRMLNLAVKDLKPRQRFRLHQITLQSYGAMALYDPKVAAEVGLSRIQSDSLTKMAADQERLDDVVEDPNASPAQALAAEQRARRQSQAVLNSILTVKQRAKWLAMIGKPVLLTPMHKLSAIKQ